MPCYPRLFPGSGHRGDIATPAASCEKLGQLPGSDGGDNGTSLSLAMRRIGQMLNPSQTGPEWY